MTEQEEIEYLKQTLARIDQDKAMENMKTIQALCEFEHKLELTLKAKDKLEQAINKTQPQTIEIRVASSEFNLNITHIIEATQWLKRNLKIM